MKQERNSPCKCGSGLKAKKCCIQKEAQELSDKLKARREYWLARMMEPRPIMPSGNAWAAIAACSALSNSRRIF